MIHGHALIFLLLLFLLLAFNHSFNHSSRPTTDGPGAEDAYAKKDEVFGQYKTIVADTWFLFGHFACARRQTRRSTGRVVVRGVSPEGRGVPGNGHHRGRRARAGDAPLRGGAPGAGQVRKVRGRAAAGAGSGDSRAGAERRPGTQRRQPRGARAVEQRAHVPAAHADRSAHKARSSLGYAVLGFGARGGVAPGKPKRTAVLWRFRPPSTWWSRRCRARYQGAGTRGQGRGERQDQGHGAQPREHGAQRGDPEERAATEAPRRGASPS